MKAALQAFWDERSSRDKVMLTVGGIVLLIFLAYQILWAPAQTGRERLKDALPEMQTQLARMSAQAQEAQPLKTAAMNPAPTGSALLNALQASLAQQGLSAQLSATGHGLQLQVKNAAFSSCVQWLDSIRREYKVRVVEAEVTALPQVGNVSLTATLQSVGQ